MRKISRKILSVLLLSLCLILMGCGSSKQEEHAIQDSKDAWMEEEMQEAEEAAEEAEEEIEETTETAEAEEEEYLDISNVEDNQVSAQDLEKYEQKEASGDVTYSDGTSTVQDQYNTDPVPAGQPNPVEPEDATIDSSQTGTCTLLVECSMIFNNWDELTEGKESLVPEDGVIYATQTVTFTQGESVFDVLLREMQNNRIHMEYAFTPGFNSNYIEGINNLYEFDCGNGSGWMYCVNGWYPNYGCSRYQVKDGDVIEWHYTCDLGRDLGQSVN